MISDHKWNTNGMLWSDGAESNALKTYDVELSTDSLTYSAKIGLIYISDYYYAVDLDYQSLPGYSDDHLDFRSVTEFNWLFMGLNEWTITYCSDYSDWSDCVFIINYDGYVDIFTVNDNKLAVRPVFYLKPEVTYASGDGSKNYPYKLRLDG